MTEPGIEDATYLALSGGVGGAKLAAGLASVLPADRLTVIANTGDDFEHLGLHVSPDLDTLMYTLAGRASCETGWGLQGETWHFLEALEELGGDTWFRLGDRDLAVHVERTRRLAQGETLSEITSAFCASLGVGPRVAPMTDQPVRTLVESGERELAFQHYFVREKCEPAVTGVRFAGAEKSRLSAPFAAALGDADLAGIVLCPSNPFLSIDPILAVSGAPEALRAAAAPVVAVTPIVGGEALKGPTAKMMRELGMPVNALEVARHYARRDLLDGFVFDEADREMAAEAAGLGVAVLVTGTVMRSLEDRQALARQVLDFTAGLRG